MVRILWRGWKWNMRKSGHIDKKYLPSPLCPQMLQKRDDNIVEVLTSKPMHVAWLKVFLFPKALNLSQVPCEWVIPSTIAIIVSTVLETQSCLLLWEKCYTGLQRGISFCGTATGLGSHPIDSHSRDLDSAWTTASGSILKGRNGDWIPVELRQEHIWPRGVLPGLRCELCWASRGRQALQNGGQGMSWGSE